MCSARSLIWYKLNQFPSRLGSAASWICILQCPECSPILALGDSRPWELRIMHSDIYGGTHGCFADTCSVLSYTFVYNVRELINQRYMFFFCVKQHFENNKNILGLERNIYIKKTYPIIERWPWKKYEQPLELLWVLCFRTYLSWHGVKIVLANT